MTAFWDGCRVRECVKAPRWLYITEYNQEEGYVRHRFCDDHADRTAPGWHDRTELKSQLDSVRPSAVGWPS